MNRKKVIRRHKRNRRIARFLFLMCCLGCFLGGFQLRSIQTAMAADTVSKNMVMQAGSEETISVPIPEQSEPRQKYFTSISISAGDSLYGIAERYISYEYETMQDYIREVREINHITGNDIRQGSYITIPYYK